MAEPVLKRGRAQHDWVVYAQQMLNQALSGGMHIDVPENGVFDEEFEAEVKGFQERVGLDNDGVIGDGTWDALKRAVEAKHAATPEEEDEPDAPRQRAQREPREQQETTGPIQHSDDNVFHERRDEDGNTVRVYDMEGEEFPYPDGHKDWDSVVTDMIETAERRNKDQIPYVIDAIGQFKEESELKIAEFAQQGAQFEQEARYDPPWELIVDALDYGLGLVFTLEGPAGWIYEQVKSALTSAVVADLTSHTSAVPALEAKLLAGVRQLATTVGSREKDAIDGVQRGIRDNIRTLMLDYSGEGQFTDDPLWVEEMVSWFGFPERDQGTVTQPILHSLTGQFDVILREAQEALLQSTDH